MCDGPPSGSAGEAHATPGTERYRDRVSKRTLRNFRSRGCVVRFADRSAVQTVQHHSERSGRGIGSGLSRSCQPGSRHTLPPGTTPHSGVTHTANPHIRHVVNASRSGRCQNQAGPNRGPHCLHATRRHPASAGGREHGQPGKSQAFRLRGIRPATMRSAVLPRVFTRDTTRAYRALTAAALAFARAHGGRVRRDQGIHILREQVLGRRKLVRLEQRHHAPPRMLAATPCRPGTNRT